MDQTIYTVLNFDKSAEVSEVPHPALHFRAHLVALIERSPGIILNLLHSQTDAPCLGIYGKHFNLDRISGIDYLAGVLHAFGPAHFRNMDQTLNAVFELYESAVVSNAGNLACDTRMEWKTLLYRRPGIRQ